MQSATQRSQTSIFISHLAILFGSIRALLGAGFIREPGWLGYGVPLWLVGVGMLTLIWRRDNSGLARWLAAFFALFGITGFLILILRLAE